MLMLGAGMRRAPAAPAWAALAAFYGDADPGSAQLETIRGISADDTSLKRSLSQHPRARPLYRQSKVPAAGPAAAPRGRPAGTDPRPLTAWFRRRWRHRP